jgi:Ala-tRNA(Pro) deacylase
MAIAPRLARYLAEMNVKYDVLPNALSPSSLRTASVARIPGDRIAKAVVLRDATGYTLAVVPASHHILLSALKRQYGDDIELAKEHEIFELFDDCKEGAVPAVGECYGLDLVVDTDITSKPEVYFEAGDRATLVHMSHSEFATLTRSAQLGHFSHPH